MRDSLISFEYALYRNNEYSPEPTVLEWLLNTAAFLDCFCSDKKTPLYSRIQQSTINDFLIDYTLFECQW